MTGTEESLRAMMAGGEIPYPPPLQYNEWITWRSREGRRPRLRSGDPRATTRAEESLLWQQVMEDVHGQDWRALIRDVVRATNGEPVTEPPTDGDRPHRAADPEDGRSAAGSSEVLPLAELQTKLEEQYDPTRGPLPISIERALRRVVLLLKL